MKSFFEEIKDSTLTWTTDDDISLSSFDSESSSGDSSLNGSSDEDFEDALHHNNDAGNDIDDEVRRNNVDAPLHEHVGDHENAEQLEGFRRQAEMPIINNEEPRNEHENPNIDEGMQGAEAPREVHLNPNGNILNRRNSMEILQNIEAHERASSLLFRIARCEVLPLIRAEIDWNLLQADLSTYPSVELGDEYGVFLLANILRMDPPCEIVKETLKLYPKSCIGKCSSSVA